MARPRKITVSAVNIRIHPHSAALYVDLFRQVFRMRRMVRVRGDQYIMMRLFKPTDNGARYEGQLSRFTKIQSDLPWFNVETLDKAEDELVDGIRIPENIYPNMVTFSFFFFPTKHLLIFESDSENATISPNIIKKYFDRIFGDTKVVQKFGSAKVDVFADKTKLDQLFELTELKRLSIEINKPNSDHWDDDLEADIEERLEEENVQTVRIEYVAEHGKSIVPNERTKNVAAVATVNGRVDAYGKDSEGEPATRSTSEIPVQETEHYDPSRTPVGAAFFRAAHSLLQRLTGLVL